jgi:hypothetical protein
MNKRFILLIEDDPGDQELIMRALWQSGIDSEIALARDGIEALEFLFGTNFPPESGRDLMPAADWRFSAGCEITG